MITYRALMVTALLGGCAIGATSVVACATQDPTKAVVENGYPAVRDGGDPATSVVVYKAWWVTTLFKEPVLPGETSEEERSVPETDFVYALLAHGWDPASGTPPAKLVAVKSKTKIGVARGSTLRIAVSDGTFAGNCDAKQALSQDEADFVTQRIFPGDFTSVTYDAKTCTTTPIPAAEDAGKSADGGAD